jgi:hypothetical protein
MKSANSYRKVAVNMTFMQLSWAVWFMSIVLVAYIVIPLFLVEMNTSNKLGDLFASIWTGNWDDMESNTGTRSYIDFLSHPAKIFMLVCGILSVANFLSFFVKQGITRKHYFYGSVVASFVVSVVIALFAGVVHLIELTVFTNDLNFGSTWLFATVMYMMQIVTYYGAGLLIGAGFYRYNAGGGMLFIVLAISLVFIVEVLWKQGLSGLISVSASWEVLLLCLSTSILLAIALIIVRMMTKRITIKLK